MIGQDFDFDDFEKNPGKYVLFRTAKISKLIDGCPGFRVGQYVAISYAYVAWNQFFKAKIPIYNVHSLEGDTQREAQLYACALSDFSL